VARELPIFEPPGAGHGRAPAEDISIAMGGAGLVGLPAADGSTAPRRHPDWIKARMPSGANYHDLKGLLRGLNLNTVCEEAHCPNVGECWDQRTATIMILGDTCTRACGFCNIKTGKPTWFDDDEPRRVADALQDLGLEHVVVTSVARDDLPDGGAGVFAETIRQLRSRIPGMGVEVLIPDFNGEEAPLRAVMEAGPDILNHNLETVKRLQKPVRKRARWDRTLGVLARAKVYAAEYGHEVHTKSSLMVGLGETRAEMTEAFAALRAVDCDIMTIGQYLRPSLRHLPLERYYHPDEFAEMRAEALAMGFRHVESGPLVRSSYHARDQVPGAELRALARRRATVDAEGRVVAAAG
jgi:lipoic acid synthetase